MFIFQRFIYYWFDKASAIFSMQNLFSRLSSHVMSVLVLTVLVGSRVSAQNVKPQISDIDFKDLPRGCSFTLDDWQGNILLWAPHYALNNENAKAMLKLDGIERSIRINSRSETTLSAFDDNRYYVEVQTSQWMRIASELRTAKSTLKVINTRTRAQTNLIVRASEGC